MKEQFSHDLPVFEFKPNTSGYDTIQQFHKDQMERLYQLPSVQPRPDNIPSRTYRHSMRVAQDVHDFARYIGIDQEMASYLQWATQLHDIGKLSIPLEILDKPGRLTDEEFTEIKRHTDYGADIIRRCEADHPILDLAVDIALYHHERMDGKGYHQAPGEEIPFHVRLVKVCDIFDALSARRPYRTDRDQMSPFDVMEAMLIDDGFLYHEVDQSVTRAFVTMKCHLLDTGLSQGQIEKLKRMLAFQDDKAKTLAQ